MYVEQLFRKITIFLAEIKCLTPLKKSASTWLRAFAPSRKCWFTGKHSQYQPFLIAYESMGINYEQQLAEETTCYVEKLAEQQQCQRKLVYCTQLA